MRTSFFSVLALASTFTSVISAPAPEPIAAVPRADFDAVSLVTDLKSTLQPDIDAIQSTATSISADSTDEEKAAASSSIAENIASLTAAVEAADAQIPVDAASKRDIAIQKRQSSAVASEIGAILSPLSAASDAVIAALGLDATLSLFNPLSVSLSKLLKDLQVVVDDLLAIVKQLLDSILSGLSKGLAGISI